MAANLTVIFWRDIPAQVNARAAGRTHRVRLHPRFQVAIDRSARRAGKTSFDDYIGEWRRQSEPCGDDVQAEAETRARGIEAEFTKEVLAKMAANGGLRAAP